MKAEDIWLVAVTAGRWQIHGICEAKALGFKILAIDADSDAEGFSYSDYTLNMSFDDHSAIVNAIKGLNLNIRGAVSFCSEVGMALAATIREAFNLPGIRSNICKRLLDKGVQREIWGDKKIPGPDWKVFDNPITAFSGASQFSIPFIIKPTDSSGSRGVTKIESVEDLHEAIDRAFYYSRSGKVIIESYMDGTEFTVEVFVIKGKVNVLAVTEKKKVEGTRGTVASELATPDRPEEVIAAIKNTVVNAFIALDYFEGPGHAEIILMKNGNVGLVEVAGRGGGFMVFDRFVPTVSGVNIAKLTALQSVGSEVEIVDLYESAAVLRFFPSKPGIVDGIHGFEKANLIKGVEASSFVKVGDRLQKATADGDRLGYVLSNAATPSEARQLADQAERLVYFDINSEQ